MDPAQGPFAKNLFPKLRNSPKGGANKKAAIRILSRLLDVHPKPRVIVTVKLRSYKKPIRQMCKGVEHRSHKRLNDRVENAHQPTRRKKCLIRFKSSTRTQSVIALMGSIRSSLQSPLANTRNQPREWVDKIS